MFDKTFKNFKALEIIVISLCHSSIQYNVDVKHRINFNPPTTSLRHPLFGYSISTLETDSYSFLVGAPKDVNNEGVETGSVYKCIIDQKTCKNIDLSFTKVKEETNSRRERFGASMVQLGGGELVVCAPSYKVKGNISKKNKESYGKYPTGECYVSNGKSLDKLPIELKLFKLKNHFNSNAQLGTSIHKNKRNDVIFGGPGVLNWKGGVFIWKYSSLEKPFCDYYASFNVGNFSYLGYSVMSLNVRNKTYYAVGIPRFEEKGQVSVFIPYKCQAESISSYDNDEFGSYFGHNLGRVDLEGDGVDELVVGAPFSNQSLGDEGRVYVYKLESANKWILLNELKGSSVEGGRYGWVVHGVGDLNSDGFEELMVAAPLEGDGVAYIHYGDTDGYSDLRVQRIELGVVTAFNSMKGTNGYPIILAGISQTDTVFLFPTRPVHSIEVNISLPEVQWDLHGCPSSKVTIQAVASANISYIIPPQELKINEYQNVIEGLRYKVVFDESVFVEIEDSESKDREINKMDNLKHGAEGNLDFKSSKTLGVLSLPFRLSIPYDRIHKNSNKAIKMALFLVESGRNSNPMLHPSQKKEFHAETGFKKRCKTTACAHLLEFQLNEKLIPLTLGYQQESRVRGKIENKAEPIFNIHFNFIHPKWASLKEVISEPACLDIKCKRKQSPTDSMYVTEKCTATEALMQTSIGVVFVLSHSIEGFGDSTEEQVKLGAATATFDPFYNSQLTALSTSSDSSLLHKTPSLSSFSTTHYYDVRTNSAHPSFELSIKEPLSSFEDDVCCHEIQTMVVLKSGADKTTLIPKLSSTSKRQSLSSFLNTKLQNSSYIKLSCPSCEGKVYPLPSLSSNQSVDVAITCNISGDLLKTLQMSKNFTYHTQLFLTPVEVIVPRTVFRSAAFNATTGVFEVISRSSAPTKTPSTPIWLVLLCLLFGLLVLMLLVLILKKFGFFRREKRLQLIEENVNKDVEEID